MHSRLHPSFIDPSQLLDRVSRCPSLWMAWLPAKVWPVIWSKLHAEGIEFVAVHVERQRQRDVFVMAASKRAFARTAERISLRDSVPLARLWLRHRRTEEVETSRTWSLPLQGQLDLIAS